MSYRALSFLALVVGFATACTTGCGDSDEGGPGPWGQAGASNDAGADVEPDAVAPDATDAAVPDDAAQDGSLEAEPVDTPTCMAGSAPGDYCGGNAAITGGDLNGLYTCNGPGPATLKEACTNGCAAASDGGGDHCSPPAEPTCISTAKTGDYCGGDKIVNGDPGTLYTCNGPGPATVKSECAQGCVVAPAGSDDYCGTTQATCSSTAKTGDYCGGDKVEAGDANTLYVCNGPGPAKVKQVCAEGCVVAPSGYDDYCKVSAPACPHAALLKWGLAPDASDHLRCAGVTASMISQTIGDAAASAGTHLQDGTINGEPYCAATDLSVSGMTDSKVYDLLDNLASQGFAAYYRKPGYDGWPSSGARHVHAIYAGVKMKSSLQSQVKDWLAGLNGLVSHTAYTFFKPTQAQKDLVSSLFNQHN
jgi:hypothetical protein